MKVLGLSVLLFFLFANPLFAQKSSKTKDTSAAVLQADTTANTYVNKGKQAARRAINRSLLLPGLGQAYNYALIVDDVKSGRAKGKQIIPKIYQIGKIAGLYVGGTMLVLSYRENNNNYHRFLHELQYRRLHNGTPDPNNGLSRYPDINALTLAKNIYKRNREIVIFSLIGLYGLNVLDAYVTARLKFFNVDETLTMQVAPSTIETNTFYGSYNVVPGIKLTLKL